MIVQNNVIKSANIVIRLANGEIIGGQLGAKFTRNAVGVDITNQITNDWKEVLPGTKSWQVNCNGIYLKNSNSLRALEDAYMNNKEVELLLELESGKYEGSAIITSFPLNAVYENAFTYTITFLGNGPIHAVSN